MNDDELVDYFAQELAKSRFGKGTDMGGKHNPLPSERRRAKDMVEVARRSSQAERE